MMRWISLITSFCWLAVGLAWLAGGIYNAGHAPRVEQKRMGLTTGWGAGIIVALVLIFLELTIPRSLLAAFSFRSEALAAIGAVILVVATAFTLWARWDLGTMWSAAPSIKEGHQLRTDGAYRITRHPIYTGLLALLFGTTLTNGFGVTLIGFIAFCVYLAFKIPTEERLLTETFGDRYDQYRRSVPALIPMPGR